MSEQPDQETLDQWNERVHQAKIKADMAESDVSVSKPEINPVTGKEWQLKEELRPRSKTENEGGKFPFKPRQNNVAPPGYGQGLKKMP